MVGSTRNPRNAPQLFLCRTSLFLQWCLMHKKKFRHGELLGELRKRAAKEDGDHAAIDKSLVRHYKKDGLSPAAAMVKDLECSYSGARRILIDRKIISPSAREPLWKRLEKLAMKLSFDSLEEYFWKRSCSTFRVMANELGTDRRKVECAYVAFMQRVTASQSPRGKDGN